MLRLLLQVLRLLLNAAPASASSASAVELGLAAASTARPAEGAGTRPGGTVASPRFAPANHHHPTNASASRWNRACCPGSPSGSATNPRKSMHQHASASEHAASRAEGPQA